MRSLLSAALLLTLTPVALAQGKGNRLAYLDEVNPYYPSRNFPKLVTPMWVGEKGVEAVVVLAIDDMRDPKRYEAYLRPILRRLQKIDGRAPVSIMTNSVDPRDPQLQTWLKEGLSLECHTLDHPCPFFKNGFAKAKETYDKCVDLLASVPNSKPVAFRMPCCDSLNTPSPRFYAEIFNKATDKGNFLSIDTSVFNVFTANDPELPRELVLNPDGTERFRPYLPPDRSFVNTVEDYPYPYVIGRLCWQFPCVTPSDWQAQHRHKPNHPRTVEDWKAALDCTVVKQGVFCLVFHPHGWIKNDQIVELIDYAVKKHGNKVKFLNFREALERLDKNLLDGVTLRDAMTADGPRVLVKDGGAKHPEIWLYGRKVGDRYISQLRQWWDGKWRVTTHEHSPKTTSTYGWERLHREQMIRFGKAKGPILKVDANSTVEFMMFGQPGVKPQLQFAVPGMPPSGGTGADHGLRFVDLDGDGFDDVLFSNEKEFGIYLFADMKTGWSRKVIAGKAGDKDALPMISRNGTNNGFWVHSGHLWWSNEDTPQLKDHVDRRSIKELLKDVPPAPKSPEASLRLLKPRPGFTAELMAAEPLVMDPIAFAFGPDGKLWVVEMGDYPLGTDGNGKFGGTVKFLEKTQAILDKASRERKRPEDASYDKATVFLDGLGYPTGVLPWGKGVLVTCAPDLFYAEDTDGDGKADKKEVLYTGFAKGNQQHRVNGLVYGLDNWIYCANGDSGGTVKSLKTGKVVDLRGRDFRIRPDTGEIDLQTGMTQFGRCRDDWGNWFGGNNSNPMWHFALADHYLRRNPHLAPPDPRVPVSVRPGVAPVFPTSYTPPRFNDFFAVNRFTSACSPIVYRDDLFGPAYANNTFVSEPVHNLVHREVMSQKGVTFTSRRAIDEEKSEFLASEDNWFRPAMIQTGPDGALWVADMYRHVIEHPQWIPKDWQKKLDLRAGHDRGRLYRVYPVGVRLHHVPRLDRFDTPGLVKTLDSSNGWQRDMAQVLLVQQKDPAAPAALLKVLRESKNAQARLHALCTLDGLGLAEQEMLPAVNAALRDAHPAVRAHALRIAEPHLRGHETTALTGFDDGTLLRSEKNLSVRMQFAYSLGEWKNHTVAGRMLAELARTDGADPYLRAAIFSSVHPRNFAHFARATLTPGGTKPVAAVLEQTVRLAAAYADRDATVALLDAISTPEKGKFAVAQLTALAAYLDTLDQRKRPLTLVAGESLELSKAINRLGAVFRQARDLAGDAMAAQEERLAALRLLGRGTHEQAEDRKLLAALLAPQHPDAVQSAAAAALGKLNAAEVPRLLLDGWKGYGPGVRGQVLDALLARPEYLNAALDALESKRVQPAEVDAARRQRLLDHKDAGVRKRATKLFAVATGVERQKLLDTYRPALKTVGEPKRGLEVFKRACATCHQVAGVGEAIGPDLAAMRDKSAEAFLIAILDPNQAVEARYVNYTAVTRDGLTYSGLLASESGNSVTLIGADGKKHALLRSDLEHFFSSGKSAMPEGLEKDIDPTQMADLLAFLRTSAPQPKRKVFPGNTPAVVRPTGDGSLKLLASNCEIYGPSLVLEKQYGNLGYWNSPDDHAVWSVEVGKAGKYFVWLDYACDGGSAGNRFALEAQGTRLTGKVAGTGSWDSYRFVRVGEINLKSGPQQIVFRSDGPIRGALIDLKEIRLVLPDDRP